MMNNLALREKARSPTGKRKIYRPLGEVRALIPWARDYRVGVITLRPHLFSLEFCGISTGERELVVDGLLSDISIAVVLPIRSSSLATCIPVLPCTGTAPVALGVVE